MIANSTVKAMSDLIVGHCNSALQVSTLTAQNAALVAALRDLCDDLDQLFDFKVAQVNRERARAALKAAGVTE